MNPFFEAHTGAIYLTEIICIILVFRLTKYLMPELQTNWISSGLMFLGNMFIGIYGGFGLVRIYFQHWPTDPILSIHWLIKEVFPFLSVAIIVVYTLYAVLVLLKVTKHPSSSS